MQEIIEIRTTSHNGLYDITDQVKEVLKRNPVKEGIVSVYVQGATAAIMIQENWDDSVQR
jgi:thiamine phosphate synthase YjbQ (UPF0047 family)